MLEKTIPDYLYHYTNINTLALILKNKTIRFNSLNRVDDLSEGLTNDLGEMGKYVFVSSWTETPEESIPFWKMYTKDMGGVRIRLKSSPFRTYRLPKISRDNFDIDVDKDIYFKPEFLFNDRYIVLPKWDILENVEYTNDPDKLYPKLIKNDGVNTEMELGIIGKYKRNEWKFQREWRYIIIFLPVSLNELCQLGDNLAQVIYDRLVAKSSLPFEDLYLNIAVDALNDMEITLGPCVNEGDKIIVESLTAKYCPTAIIRNSVLENSIRI